jgi:hypothetical protein
VPLQSSDRPISELLAPRFDAVVVAGKENASALSCAAAHDFRRSQLTPTFSPDAGCATMADTNSKLPNLADCFQIATS